MDEELVRSIASLVTRLSALAATDQGLRDDLRVLAGALAKAAEGPAEEAPPTSPGQADATGPGIAPEPASAEPAPAAPASPPSPLPELTFGRAAPSHQPVRIEPLRWEASKRAAMDSELPAVEARCRLKAEGIRWAATRSRRIEEGADFRLEIAPRDREILDRAGEISCFLWMNSPDFTIPRDFSALEDLAGWYEALADAIALVRSMLPDAEANREFFEPALDLMAEAQSALRVAVDRADGPRDGDQYRAYDWLRDVTARERIYISRHMRIDDPADPARLPELENRIEDLDARFQQSRDRGKRRKSVLSQLRYHVKRIDSGKGDEHDWRKIVESVDELVAGGTPPSSVEIREAILPVLEAMPDLDSIPAGFQLVLKEIDRYLATRAPAPESAPAERPTPEVALAARLLAGRSAVLIGGSRRPGAHEALKAALNLAELTWLETKEHESIDHFEPYVARPDVAVVLLAIRWSSHSFGEVRRFCDRHGKPMVRLPGGYGVNQVAAQVVAQCSEQLQEGWRGGLDSGP
ncbi:hypothetical protein [Aquisphaera insulae]|uniref:hypothetical protein n=1 Tax=Aquisphaera insulae TaxID=2712864 RepID=UPI0013EBCEDF|nr:hypothetical protein [Aquisphaera insulae]